MKDKKKGIIALVGIAAILLFALFPIDAVDIDTTIGVYRQNGLEVSANDIEIEERIPTTELKTLELVNSTTPVDAGGNELKDTKAVQEPDLLSLLFEPQEQIAELKLNFSTKKTFNDGTKITTPISQLDLTIDRPLDFIVVSDENKPITDGKIDIVLEEFSQGFKDSNLVVDYFVNDELKETIKKKVNQKGTIIKTVEMNNLFSSSEQGTKTIKLVARELFIVTPSGNFYLPTSTVLYQAEFTKDITQTIVKNEKGEFVKIFDTDISFSFQSVSDKNSWQTCTLKSFYGCYQYSTATLYSIPPSASATILDSSGKIFASGSASGASCPHVGSISGPNWCTQSLSSIVLSTKLQRGETYTFKPNCLGTYSITITVPTDKNISYYYYCSNKAHNFNT